MRILLVGHGRLGRAIETQALATGVEIAGVLDEISNVDGRGLAEGRWDGVDVAIDASTPAAFVQNVPHLVRLGVNLVIGTTGWQAQEPAVREAVAQAGIGIVAAANFSIGAVVMQELAARAAGLMAPHHDYAAWLHESHHAAKQDAPSGTARQLVEAMTAAGYDRRVDVASTRAGFIPGTHIVGFEGEFESLALTHTVRDRAVFAVGALTAARWICGRQGWFTMRDVLGLP
jgi:4-hydroxy-tetrahydrodipicolinate reductase